MRSDASLVSSPPRGGSRIEQDLVRLRSLQHVSSPYPDGEDGSVRRFYRDVLGLREQPTPSTLAHMRLLWFTAGDGLELHFFPDPPNATTHPHLPFPLPYLHTP